MSEDLARHRQGPRPVAAAIVDEIALDQQDRLAVEEMLLVVMEDLADHRIGEDRVDLVEGRLVGARPRRQCPMTRSPTSSPSR